MSCYYKYMHSTQFTRLAQAADSFSMVIHSMTFLDATPDDGVFPSAWCILFDPDDTRENRYAVSMGVLPTDEDREAFFTSSTYDLSLARAVELFHTKTLSYNRIGAWA